MECRLRSARLRAPTLRPVARVFDLALAARGRPRTSRRGPSRRGGGSRSPRRASSLPGAGVAADAWRAVVAVPARSRLGRSRLCLPRGRPAYGAGAPCGGRRPPWLGVALADAAAFFAGAAFWRPSPEPSSSRPSPVQPSSRRRVRRPPRRLAVGARPSSRAPPSAVFAAVARRPPSWPPCAPSDAGPPSPSGGLRSGAAVGAVFAGRSPSCARHVFVGGPPRRPAPALAVVFFVAAFRPFAPAAGAALAAAFFAAAALAAFRRTRPARRPRPCGPTWPARKTGAGSIRAVATALPAAAGAPALGWSLGRSIGRANGLLHGTRAGPGVARFGAPGPSIGRAARRRAARRAGRGRRFPGDARPLGHHVPPRAKRARGGLAAHSGGSQEYGT